MPKTIKYKGTEFRVIENNLKILNKAVPVLLKHEMLTAHYNKEYKIDTSRIDEFNERIKTYETVINQLTEKPEISEEEQTYLTDIENKLLECRTEMANDEEIKYIRNMQNIIAGMVLMEISTNEELIQLLINNILIGDISIIKVDEQDVSEYLSFVGQVLTVFFSVMRKNSKQ